MHEPSKKQQTLKNLLLTILIGVMGAGGGLLSQKLPVSKAEPQTINEVQLDEIKRSLEQIKTRLNQIELENISEHQKLNNLSDRFDEVERKIYRLKGVK